MDGDEGTLAGAGAVVGRRAGDRPAEPEEGGGGDGVDDGGVGRSAQMQRMRVRRGASRRHEFIRTHLDGSHGVD